MIDVHLLTNQLHAAAPQAILLTQSDDVKLFAIDEVTPRLAALPATIEETAAIMKYASEQHLTVLPVGGGTDLELGQPPEHYDLALSTTRLNALLEHEAADLTCSVQAGITLADLQQQLKTKGQFLALDPPHAQHATIGGILAANASGPQRLRYGSARDLVIGLRVVLADGTIARSGGKVVKNVAGYDLNKLYIGSMGTLGIIVEANFKLIPCPEQEQTLLVAFDSTEQAMRAAISLLGSVVTPSALELLDQTTQQAIQQQTKQTLPACTALLAISFAGVARAVSRQISDTQTIVARAGGQSGGLLEADGHTHFWDATRQQQNSPVTCKVSLLLDEIAPFLAGAQNICQEHQLTSSANAHAGSGIIYLQLQPADAADRLANAISRLRVLAQSSKGSLVVTRAPALLKAKSNVWGEARPDLKLMETLKQKFDPAGILVKGRFVGGL
jgi:glycolate oxidase FAD binding subunit